ncbi:glycosyltransferase [Silvanigrella paludirubra]|uniref:Glycosyltransferase n=1 Tax=Silvanigrella paludirubra TaxID=2499159 RepID=A0A6N6VVZ1_9BACT|nr:glycosyltransferase [Silvanigrella paludirubra]KAB8040770.1 glycosyltransferase [Silvanigrella paludirubra]
MEKRKKHKILFIIMNLCSGGAERVLLNLTRELDKKKYDIHIFIVKNHIEYISEIPEEVTIHYGIEKDKNIYFNFPIILLKLIKIAFNSNRIIGALEYWPTFLSTFLSIILFKKCINWVHIDIISHLKNQKFYIKILSKFVYRFTDISICVSNSNLISFKKNFIHKKSDFIYNIIDFDKINLLSKEAIPEEDKINYEYIIAIGRVEYPKDYTSLITAYYNLKKKNNIKEKFLIFGNGSDYKNIITLIDRLGLNEDVILMGFHENVFKYLKNAKLFIHASYCEGFGLVLLEALYLGKIVLAAYKYKHGPFNEVLLNGKCGLIIEEYDNSILENAILKTLNLSDFEKEKYIQNGYNRIKDFDKEKIISKWDQILTGKI